MKYHIIDWPILFLILVVFILIGCKKDIELPNPHLQELFGEWEWVKSNPGDGGPFIYPASTGNTVNVKFNKNGIFKMYKNEKLEVKEKFTLQENSQHPIQPLFYIDYENSGKARMEFKQDTLILDFSFWCFDCGVAWYVRK